MSLSVVDNIIAREYHKCTIVSGLGDTNTFVASIYSGYVWVERLSKKPGENDYKYFFQFFLTSLDPSKSPYHDGIGGRSNSCLMILDNGFAQRVTMIRNNGSVKTTDEGLLEYRDDIDFISAEDLPAMTPHIGHGIFSTVLT